MGYRSEVAYGIKIDDIVFNDSTVEVTVTPRDKSVPKKYSPTFEEFITLLYNYQLFR